MAMAEKIDLFHEALDFGLQILGAADLQLKEKQYEVIKSVVLNKEDVLAVLPTGYGKSLIYQLLPSVFNVMNHGGKPEGPKSTVIVISPLNALIRDQIVKMREGGLSVCVLRGDRVATEDHDDSDEIAIDVPTEKLLSGHFDLIFSHPEVLVESKKVSKLLKTPAFNEKVRAIVVDEAHLVVDWKSFRPAYGKLDLLTSIFPETPILGLTATATKAMQQKIGETLGLIKPVVIDVNPDRKNIYFSSSRRGNHGDDRLYNVLAPLLEDLQSKRQDFPLTIIYGNLETIADCFSYFSSALGNAQYEPMDAPKVAKNRMFTQYHAQYPEQERQRIVDELVQGKSKIRIIFATVAFGIGLDISNIRQVIHIGVPYTMEEYFQEAGRAGRDGLPAKAHIFFNAYDISMGKKQLSNIMRKYVQEKRCKREMILNYFAFKSPTRSGPLHECCDFHENLCNCDDCVISGVATIFEEGSIQDVTTSTEVCEDIPQLPPDLELKLREELYLFRLSLPGTGRSSVGGTSLSSGITLDLIDQVVKNVHLLTSEEKIEEILPIFSRKNAAAIWKIIQKYI